MCLTEALHMSQEEPLVGSLVFEILRIECTLVRANYITNGNILGSDTNNSNYHFSVNLFIGLLLKVFLGITVGTLQTAINTP